MIFGDADFFVNEKDGRMPTHPCGPSAARVLFGALEGPPLLPELLLSEVEVVRKAKEFKSKVVNLKSEG